MDSRGQEANPPDRTRLAARDGALDRTGAGARPACFRRNRPSAGDSKDPQRPDQEGSAESGLTTCPLPLRLPTICELLSASCELASGLQLRGVPRRQLDLVLRINPRLKLPLPLELGIE